MNDFEKVKAEMVAALAEAHFGDEVLTSLRRQADLSIAELVEAGYPRAAAGAVTLTAIMDALNATPSFQQAKLADLLEQVTTMRPAKRPMDVTIALAIVICSVGPDPEFADGAR